MEYPIVKYRQDIREKGRKPQDNALVESFNGSFRDECLNVNWFVFLVDARDKIEAWRVKYNEWRPHSSLGDMTPSDFAKVVAEEEAQDGSKKLQLWLCEWYKDEGQVKPK
jgi:transposase InsO family protein